MKYLMKATKDEKISPGDYLMMGEDGLVHKAKPSTNGSNVAILGVALEESDQNGLVTVVMCDPNIESSVITAPSPPSFETSFDDWKTIGKFKSPTEVKSNHIYNAGVENKDPLRIEPEPKPLEIEPESPFDRWDFL
jgi:hypothetical protein